MIINPNESNNDIATKANIANELNHPDNHNLDVMIPNDKDKTKGKAKINNKSKHPSYFLIKVPAKVTNIPKAIELLGGKKEIVTKSNKNENIDLNLFTKKIPLEKCISNDLLLRKKTKRNKKKYISIITHFIYSPQITKIEYETIGSISNQYDYFALHDFIYYNNPKASVDLNELKKFAIKKEDYLEQLEPIEKITQTEKTKAIHVIQENYNKAYGYDKLANMDISPFFQLNQIAYGRFSYPKVFKELYENIDIDDNDNKDEDNDDES